LYSDARIRIEDVSFACCRFLSVITSKLYSSLAILPCRKILERMAQLSSPGIGVDQGSSFPLIQTSALNQPHLHVIDDKSLLSYPQQF
jgi:hypothetical protein